MTTGFLSKWSLGISNMIYAVRGYLHETQNKRPAKDGSQALK